MSARIASRILIATIAILLGGVFYLFYRPEEAIFFSWIRSAGISFDLESTKSFVGGYLFHLPDWLVFSLPDGLWAFSYAVLISTVWNKQKSLSRAFWIISIPVITIGTELIQLSGRIPGTFCPIDLIFIVTGIIAGYIIGTHNLKL